MANLTLKGKVIVLTGGASGMGLENAKILAAKGVKLSIADVQEAALLAVVEDLKKIGSRSHSHRGRYPQPPTS
jgi:NAD(P)-dependent dehydrogenase (short-subunit alcohol dehydrogenase family)